MKSTLDKALVEGKSYHMQNSFSRLLEPKHDDVVDGGVDELSGAQCNHFWSGTEGLVVLTVALFCGVFARLVLKRTKIPYTVLLACLGGLLGVLHDVSYQSKFYSESALGLSSEAWVHINPHLMLFVFLPILVFDAALNCEWHIFKRQIWQILALAIPGVMLSTILTASVFKFVLFPSSDRWDWNVALMTGAILSATDPVAIVALMKELGVSERLATLMEGASSLSDATTFLIFQVCWSQLQQGSSVCDVKTIDDGGEIIIKIIRLFAGGMVLGLTVGWLLQFCLSRCINDMRTEVTLTFLAAFGTMLLAEATMLEFNGIVSLVTLGLTMSASGKFCLSSEAAHVTHTVWGILGHLANTVIFFVAGLIITGPDVLGSNTFIDSIWKRCQNLIVLFFLLQVIRVLMIVSLWPILSRGHYEFNCRHATAVSYAGLRGAVGLCLALVVQNTLSEYESPYDEDAENEASIHLLGEEILFYISGVAMLSLLINGTTIEMVFTHLGLVGSAQEGAQLAYERITLELAKEVTQLLEKLKRGEAQDINGVDWAAALAYVPARSEPAHQLLNEAINKEVEFAPKRGELTSATTQTQTYDSSNEQPAMNKFNSFTFERDLLEHQSGHVLDRRLSKFGDISGGFAIENCEENGLDELLKRAPHRLRGRITRNEKKWPSVLSAMSGIQKNRIENPSSDIDDNLFSTVSTSSSNQAAPTTRDRKADMVELRRRFGVALKSCYSRLHHEGHCEAASIAALVDGANRQIDDSEHDAKNEAVVISRAPSLGSTRNSDLELVRSRTDAFVSPNSTTEARGGRISRSSTDVVAGKQFDSWKHFLDAVDGGVPTFLGSRAFSVLLNTPGLRTGLKKYLAQQLGAVFDTVDGFVVGHERTLALFLDEHAQGVDQGTASHLSLSGLGLGARPEFQKNCPPADLNMVEGENNKMAKRMAALTVEVQAQVRLARNWLDGLLRRFPEVALSIKTKKAARLLLSGERTIVERMGHEGTIDDFEVKLLMEANAISVKKLNSHPASLAVPSKIQIIRRHPLFKNITENAAAALAKHCTEKYFDPNTCLLEQNGIAKHWLLPIQGTYKIYQSTASLSPTSLPTKGHDDTTDEQIVLTEAQSRAAWTAASLAAEVATYQGSVLPGAVDVTNGTLHGIDVNELDALGGFGDDFRNSSSGCSSVLNAPLGLEDALGAAGLLWGGGKGETYRYSVHSPGFTHVLVVNGKATAEIMNEHPSLRGALWRIVAASMLLRNPRWVEDVTKASAAMSVAAKVGESGAVNEALSGTQPAWTIPAGVSGRQLALSIVQPHRSKRDRSLAGYIEIVINNRGLGSLAQQDGDTSKHLIPDAAAMLLLDGTLRLNRSLASLLNNNMPKAQPAVVGGGPNNEAHVLGVDEASTGDAGLKLVSCAAAVTCGGPGEPSSVDGTATVSRLVPSAPVGSKELRQVQFAPGSVFLVLSRQDFVDAALHPPSSYKPSKPSVTFTEREAESAPVPPVETLEKTVSFLNLMDDVMPESLSGTDASVADAAAVRVDGRLPQERTDELSSTKIELDALLDRWTTYEDQAPMNINQVAAADGETTWGNPTDTPARESEI